VIKLGTIAKLARAKMAPTGIGPDELAEMVAELASSFGMKLEIGPVPLDCAELSFHQTAAAALRADSKIFGLRGRMKSGDALEGLIVLVPAEAPEK
jgi:hypothetical protein